MPSASEWGCLEEVVWEVERATAEAEGMTLAVQEAPEDQASLKQARQGLLDERE